MTGTAKAKLRLDTSAARGASCASRRAGRPNNTRSACGSVGAGETGGTRGAVHRAHVVDEHLVTRRRHRRGRLGDDQQSGRSDHRGRA